MQTEVNKADLRMPLTLILVHKDAIICRSWLLPNFLSVHFVQDNHYIQNVQKQHRQCLALFFHKTYTGCSRNAANLLRIGSPIGNLRVGERSLNILSLHQVGLLDSASVFLFTSFLGLLTLSSLIKNDNIKTYAQARIQKYSTGGERSSTPWGHIRIQVLLKQSLTKYLSK